MLNRICKRCKKRHTDGKPLCLCKKCGLNHPRCSKREHIEQIAVTLWARGKDPECPNALLTYPELEGYFAIPNGADMTEIQRDKMIREGLLAGIPDICLPVPYKYRALLAFTNPPTDTELTKHLYNTLYVEMKAPKVIGLCKLCGCPKGHDAGTTSKEQKEIHDILRKLGNKVIVCYTFEEAKANIIEYLGGERSEVKPPSRMTSTEYRELLGDPIPKTPKRSNELVASNSMMRSIGKGLRKKNEQR